MTSARCYLIITGAYVKIVTNLIRALFCLKASYVQGASKKKKFCTKCSSSNYFRKQHFLDCLTSLLPPSTFFIFPLKSLSSLLIMLVCQNVVWHRCQRFWIIKKKCFFHFYQILTMYLIFAISSILNFVKSLVSSNIPNSQNLVLL